MLSSVLLAKQSHDLGRYCKLFLLFLYQVFDTYLDLSNLIPDLALSININFSEIYSHAELEQKFMKCF